MGKKGKAVAAGAAVAAGPSGLRRVAGGCLAVVLLIALAIAGLVALATYMASRDGGLGGDDDVGLACPPDEVAVAYTPAEQPEGVQDAVEDALTDAGREITAGGYDEGQSRDVVVSWWQASDPNPPEVSGRSTVSLRLQEVPTAEEVQAALGGHLTPCEDPEPTEEPDEAPEEAQEQEEEDEGSSQPFAWPWASGWSPVVGIGLAVAAWWLVGPQVVHWTWEAFWPVRLTIRKLQRWQWRREVAREEHTLPTWPEPPIPGERWDTNPEAMRDHRTFRQQIRQTEPERRAVLRERIREGRLRGEGILPVRLWRVLYRVPRTRDTR